jgi:hypothetical protein
MEKTAQHVLRISKQWMVKIASIPMLVCTIVLLFRIPVCDTCCLSQMHPNYLLSLVDICDAFYVFVVEVHECAIR